MENKITPELVEKAKQVKTPEELIDIAKVNNMELSKEEAQAYFNQLNKTGELSDDELNNVAGGGCYTKDGRMVTTVGNWCNNFVCKKCGGNIDMGSVSGSDRACGTCGGPVYCNTCKLCTYEKGLWLCNNPYNKK